MAFASDQPRRFRPTDDTDDVPPTPPASVLAEVDAAYARAEELRAMGCELHFGAGPGRRLVLEVRGRDGAVLRTLPPSAALDFMTGGLH
ncbi:MAG TPA: hypothetical protein VN213_03060 [Solirubrobacteraceae bacterium]|nr:hypothetical protein [Solirubrobacteraceae bacterium]